MVKPVGSLADELVGDITMHGALKMVKNGKPLGPLADCLIGIVNLQWALK